MSLPLTLQAEVYRWVDEQGKVHFSDKKPQQQSTKIGEQLKDNNVDSSQAQQRKLQQLLAPETPEEKRYRQQKQQKKQQQQTRKQGICQNARRQLKILRGPVAFLDSQGKELPISEKERQQRAAKLQKQIKQHCGDY